MDLNTVVNQISELIDNSSRQNWLFGAGISCDANIPLMYPLTDKVFNDLSGRSKILFEKIRLELKDKPKPHVEHVLSHLGDLIAISERLKNEALIISSEEFVLEEMTQCYKDVISSIVQTIRFGYNSSSAETGSISNPIIIIDHHLTFIEALFSNRSNLESRSIINFFTTNYDTLLEDALSIKKHYVIDGFDGSAIGYWNGDKSFEEQPSSSNKFKIYKLHGSVDWYNDLKYGLIRCRYGVNYLKDVDNVLIYPQATKYIETQKDPFATLFKGFRDELNNNSPNVLIVCGYSFGDNHINNEIEFAMNSRNNKTTVIAFIKNSNEFLDKLHTEFPDRVYIVCENHIQYKHIEYSMAGLSECWKFTGLTNFLTTRSI